MRFLVDKHIKLLFGWIVLFTVLFTGLSAIFIHLNRENAIVYAVLFSASMGIAILIAEYQYFKRQDRVIEDVIIQIQGYISGNYSMNIECNEEGQLYRLFHEINALGTILNAQAQNERTIKLFLKDIISDISHQLKTPLTTLGIYNGIMQEEAQDIAVIQRFTSFSEQELERMNTIIKNTLKITKFDAGTIIIDKSIENIAEMMVRIKNYFSYRAKAEEKRLYFSGDDTVVLLCDRTWIIEAVSNIVKNAFDHTKQGNTISIEWKQLASIIQVVIKDDGSGIHPEDLYHIFKRFYRSRFSTNVPGIGLGLPLAKAIIEAHNGTIEVDSALNRGTTFTINFLIPTKL